MRRLLLVGIILYLMAVALVANYALGPRPCISSNIVNSIAIQAESENGIENISTLHNCRSVNVLSAIFEAPILKLRAAARRIQEIEVHMTQLAPAQMEAVDIVIDSSHPYKFESGLARLVVGEEFIDSTGHLEKAVIQKWLEQSHPRIANDLYLLEITSQFYWYQISGSRWEVEEVFGRAKLSHSEMQWPAAVSSFRQYCLQPWRANFHNDYCIQQNSFADGDPESAKWMSEPTIWSLVNLMSRGLQLYVDQLPLEKKYDTILSLGSRMTESLGKGLLQLPEEPSSYSSLLKWSRTYINDLISIATASDVNTQLLKQVYDNLQLSNEQAEDIRLIVEEGENYLFEPLYTWSKLDSQLRISLRRSGETYYLPSRNSVTLRDSVIPSRISVIAGCKFPSIENLVGYAEHADEILFVDTCSNVDRIKWKWLLTSGVESFIQANPKLRLISFHVPSLKLAIRRSQSTAQSLTSENMPQWLKWEKLVWDQLLQAYKPLAVLDAVKWVRSPKLIEKAQASRSL